MHGRRWPPHTTRDAKRVAEFGLLASRLREEKFRAEPIIRTIRRMAAARIAVALPAEWITAAVADGLTDASEEVVAAAPAVALALASYALEVATRLDARNPAIVRPVALARAWTAIAMAHSRRCDLQPALAALDRADAALHGHAALGHDCALVADARAGVLVFGRRGASAPGPKRGRASFSGEVKPQWPELRGTSAVIRHERSLPLPQPNRPTARTSCSRSRGHEGSRHRLQTTNLNGGEQQAKATDPRPIRDIAGHAYHSEVRNERNDIKNQADKPSDLFRSFSSASCHDRLHSFRCKQPGDSTLLWSCKSERTRPPVMTSSHLSLAIVSEAAWPRRHARCSGRAWHEDTRRIHRMSILIWIIVGLVAGVLASMVMGGTGYGIVGDIIIGIVGAFVGGWLFAKLGVSAPFGGLPGTIFVAFIGAVVLLFVLRLLRGGAARAR